MESLSERTLLEAAHEQITEELDELFELPTTSASQEELFAKRRLFIARLSEDDELCGEVRERLLSEGRSSDKYALLSKLWSDTPDAAKEPFFVWLYQCAKPPERPKPPWERYATYQGNEEHYREDLYSGVAFARTDLHSFASEWLEELLDVGYRAVEEPSGLPAKERKDESAVPRPAGHGEARPVTFEDTWEVLWLRPGGRRSFKYGHREVAVSDEPLRTDKAILAALVAMEARPTNIKQLRKALPRLKLPLERPMREQWRAAQEDLPEWDVDNPDDVEEQHHKRLKKHELLRNLQHLQPLDFVLLLLRHHRPGFDDLPHEKKLAFIVERVEDVARNVGLASPSTARLYVSGAE